MLFNSVEFLFLFLPVLLIVFFQLAKHSYRFAAAWLTLGSLFFYAWWNPAYVALLLASILFNYLVGRTLVLGLGLLSLTRPSEFLTHKINRTLTPINPDSEALEMM